MEAAEQLFWQVAAWAISAKTTTYERKVTIMIEDIEFSTLPTLRDRAEHSLTLAEEARAQREEDIMDELREQTYEFLVQALLVDAGTASAAMFSARPAQTNHTKKDGHPGDPALNLALLVTVDSLTFRAHFEKVKAFTLGSSENKEFASETIYDDKLVVEWRSPGSSFYKITDLATLGAEMKEHVR